MMLMLSTSRNEICFSVIVIVIQLALEKLVLYLLDLFQMFMKKLETWQMCKITWSCEVLGCSSLFSDSLRGLEERPSETRPDM